jgi:hypothetical protein
MAEVTDAELAGWARGFILFLENLARSNDKFVPSPDTLDNMRSIAAKLERPADVMSPAEFAERMRKIAEVVGDPEMSHGEGDQLMTDLLCQLGYGEGSDVFDKMPKWYA